jgi:hypothetical protein
MFYVQTTLLSLFHTNLLPEVQKQAVEHPSIITHQQMHQIYLLFKLCFNNSH